MELSQNAAWASWVQVESRCDVTANKNAFSEYVEALCGITMTPEKELMVKIKLPNKKEQIKVQKPAYDEETIFNDTEIINEINKVCSEYNIRTLANLYDALNHWHMPEIFAEILDMPKYLYDQFELLPLSIRNKSITPLMKLLKEIMIKKVVREFRTQMRVSSSAVTWEEYIADEY